MKFNQILKGLREDNDIKQVDLAKILNISNRMLSYYESDRFPNDPDLLIKMANHFNVSVDYLLGNEAIKTIKKELTPEEIDLIEMFRDLDRKEKNDILEFVDLKHERFLRNKKLSSSQVHKKREIVI